MEEGKKNIIGDLIMSTTMGCIFVFSFFTFVGIICIVFLYFLSILKPFF
jgi:hypothetical protein